MIWIVRKYIDMYMVQQYKYSGQLVSWNVTINNEWNATNRIMSAKILLGQKIANYKLFARDVALEPYLYIYIYIFCVQGTIFSSVDIEHISVEKLEHRPKCRILQILNFWNVTLPRPLQSKPCLAYDYTIPRFLHDHKRGKVGMKTTWKTLQEV